jgi:hypothetical protein
MSGASLSAESGVGDGARGVCSIHRRRRLADNPAPMPISRRAIVIASLVACVAQIAPAQELRGTIVDSASRRPIASAVLVLLDEAGVSRSRTITNDRGQYRIAVPSDARKIRALRLGYRARELALPGGVVELDIAMIVIPTLLEKVTVQAARACPRRDDSQSALALLEQARAGLLATIVASESNPATMKLLRYERMMDGTSDRVMRQVVHIDSIPGKKKSFEAASSAADFVRNGFSRDSGGGRMLFGPDAEVLLDDAFANAYCFRLADRERERPYQVGLGFTAADQRRDRTDLDGVLWIDTLARRLVDIEFRYEGIRMPYNAPRSSGHVHFREMPNGMVVIDSWVLVIGAARYDTTGDFRHPTIRQSFDLHEIGGEVARAVWADGRAWRGPLGSVTLKVVTGEGEPEHRVLVRLGESDYLASPDANGNLEIPDVLPGPYPSVAAAGAMLGAPLKVTAVRDSTFRGLVVSPPREAFLRRHCDASPSFTWVTASVTRDDGSVVNGARWEVGSDFDTSWEVVYARGITGAQGLFGFCNELAGRDVNQLRVHDGGEPRNEVVVRLTRSSERVKVTLPTRATTSAPPT